MTKLNRFPLLGLWAEEAARRAGYCASEAEALGHAYAVLYAIRANRHKPQPGEAGDKEQPARRRPAAEHVEFGGDAIDVTRDANGRLLGLVGGERPQTPRSYRASVRAKFPGDYYDRLRKAFAAVLRAYPPRTLAGGMVYDLYDEWKKTCGVGRLVDLDRLLEWCAEHTPARPARRAVARAGRRAASSAGR